MRQDRRSQIRWTPSVLFTASLASLDGRSVDGTVLDLSATGVRLATDPFTSPIENVVLGILFPFITPTTLFRAQGKVVWADSDAQSLRTNFGSVSLGVQFTFMDSLAHSLLMKAFEGGHCREEAPATSSQLLQQAPFLSAERETSLVAANGRIPSRGDPAQTTMTNVSGTAGTVLIVQEQLRGAERLHQASALAGFSAVTVPSGRAALQAASQLKPRLVVMSINVGLPGFSHIARKLKDSRPAIPVATVTQGAEMPFLLADSFPVDASLNLTQDLIKLAQTIRLVASTDDAVVIENPQNAIEGEMQGNVVAEILQYLFSVEKTGRFLVRAGRRAGSIYIENGNVMHADFAGLEGKLAFNEIVSFLSGGQFSFEANVRTARSTMSEKGTHMILDAARELDVMNHGGLAS